MCPNSSCDVKGDGDVDYHEFALNLTQVCPPATREAKASVTAQDFIPPSQQRLATGYVSIASTLKQWSGNLVFIK